MGLREERGSIPQIEIVSGINNNCETKIDVPTYSKIENGKVLPITKHAQIIADMLGKEATDIYPEEDLIYFAELCGIAPKTRGKSKREDCYKLTARLPRWVCKWLEADVLKKCGYKGITDFIFKSILRMKKQYEIITAKEKAAQLRTERQGKTTTNIISESGGLVK